MPCFPQATVDFWPMATKRHDLRHLGRRAVTGESAGKNSRVLRDGPKIDNSIRSPIVRKCLETKGLYEFSTVSVERPVENRPQNA